MSKTVEIGPYSAYAIAVKYGYTGTEEQWVKEQEANRVASEQAAQQAEQAREGAEAAAARAESAADRAESAQQATESAKTDALTAIGTSKQDALDAVQEAQNGAVEVVSAAETAATEAVQTAQDAATSAVSAAQTTAIKAVDAKGKEALANISTGIDPTLSVSGKAADAKMTGDKIGELKEDIGHLSESKISKFYASNQGETHLADSDDGKIMDMMVYGKSSQDGTPTLTNPIEIKSVVNPTVNVLKEDGTESQTATLPYTLNAIPVSSAGNVTIAGQQYIADYVDVERGKLVRMVAGGRLYGTGHGFTWNVSQSGTDLYASRHPYINEFVYDQKNVPAISNAFRSGGRWGLDTKNAIGVSNGKSGFIFIGASTFESVSALTAYLDANEVYVYSQQRAPVETDLTAEEIAAFKALASYYPTTNVACTSDQLDGYTVFDYLISLSKGYDNLKTQLGDTRDYLYDMDLMTAEAYVNAEYAAALAELE